MLYSNEKAGIVIRHAFENTKGIISGLKTLNENVSKYRPKIIEKFNESLNSIEFLNEAGEFLSLRKLEKSSILQRK